MHDRSRQQTGRAQRVAGCLPAATCASLDGTGKLNSTLLHDNACPNGTNGRCQTENHPSTHTTVTSMTIYIFPCSAAAQRDVSASIFLRFLDHTRRITVSKTPLGKRSAHRTDLYLTIHNRQTSVTLAGFEPAIPARERPQTHALDRVATGIGV